MQHTPAGPEGSATPPEPVTIKDFCGNATLQIEVHTTFPYQYGEPGAMIPTTVMLTAGVSPCKFQFSMLPDEAAFFAGVLLQMASQAGRS